MTLNSLLLRQLRKHLPELSDQDPLRTTFLAAVSTAYDELQRDRILVAHTLEVVSTELTAANEKLRHEAANQLQSLSRYFQQTLEMQQGMILCFKKTERGFQHTLCRGRLAHRLGWSSERVEGHLLEEILPAAEAETMSNIYAQAWAGEECTYERNALEGSLIYLAQFRPRKEGVTVCEVIVSCVEISELKRFERELLTAKDRAEAADRAKSEFLAVMSHEIRTPLNAILGFGQLLKESELSEKQQSWLSAVETSGESLRELIDDILDFSKIEAGKLELHHQAICLPELLESIAAMFRPRAAQKKLAFHLVLSTDLPRTILTDRTRLRQIVVNLVSNAIKFTQQGSITLSASIAKRSASSETPEWLLLFEVIDTGLGIKLGQRDRLFKPFSQADSSTTRTYGGTGLGLAICKRLVGALGGEIDFESRDNLGSRFFFTISARGLSPSPEQPKTSAPNSLAIPQLRILIVEDHPTNRLLIEQILLRVGCRADFVKDGKEAVMAATAREYDLIVMDLQMPEMDGFATTREIRASRVGRSQPRIVALTADIVSERQHKCLAEGMNAVLPKPIRADALLAELARAVPTGPGLPG